MVCQRHEVELYDPVEGMQLNQADNPAPALNPNFTDHGQCVHRDTVVCQTDSEI